MGSSSGNILFVRELTYPWNAENEQRLATDINRTIGYARQRVGANIGGAWLIGELAKPARATLEPKIETTLDQDEETAVPEFWMLEVSALRLGLESNFIPTLARSSVSFRTFMRTAIGMCAATWLCAAVFFGAVEYNIAKHLRDRQSVIDDIANIQSLLGAKDSEIASIQKQENTLNLLNVDAFDLPALFLSHLGDMVPDGLILKQAEVTRDDSGWSVSLRGELSLSLAEIAPQLTELQQRLVSAPWNARITKSWEASWMRQLDSGSALADGGIEFEVAGRFQ